ncbi:MAG: AAA family ATPase [Candidatus Hodarchaeales archaeon]
MSVSIQQRLGEGFELLSIKMKRFMNYQNTTEFNFDAPYIVVTGPTGAGKTTILDALTFALFGKNSRTDLPSVRIENVCKRGGKVQCIFKSGKNIIRVQRGREKNGKSSLQLWINNQRITGTIPDLNAKIMSILGMNYLAFTHSTIIRQEEMKSLGSKKPTERMKTLQNLFRLDIFEKAKKTAQNRLQELKIKRSNIEGKLQEKMVRIAEIPKREQELKILKPETKNVEKDLEKINEELESLKKEDKNLRRENEKYHTIIEKKKTTQQEISKLSNKLDKSIKTLKEFQDLKKKHNELEEKIKDLQNVTTEIQSLESLKKQYELMEKHFIGMKNDFEKQEQELQRDLKRKLHKITEKKKRTEIYGDTVDQEEAFKILNQEGRLLERIQRISIERTWDLAEKLLSELKQEQSKARDDLKVILQRKEKISKDSFVISEIKKQISELEAEEKEIREKITVYEDKKEKELSEKKKELEKLGFDDEKKKKLKVLEKKKLEYLQIQKEYEKVNTAFEKTTDPSPEIKVYQEDIKSKREELLVLEGKLEKYSEFEQRYLDFAEKLEQTRNTKNKLTEKLAMKRERIRNLKEEIRKLKNIEPEIATLKKELSEIANLEDIYTKLKDEVFHTRGTPFYAINKILPRLSRRASFILAELTDNRLSIIDLRRNEGSTMGFEILVYTPEGYRDVATFSGGEKTQINAALRLAISEELTAISGATDSKKTLFIDEGDLGSLDTIQAQQAFVKKLFQLTQSFKIILITHLTEVANQFPYTITITRDASGRSTTATITES